MHTAQPVVKIDRAQLEIYRSLCHMWPCVRILKGIPYFQIVEGIGWALLVAGLAQFRRLAHLNFLQAPREKVKSETSLVACSGMGPKEQRRVRFKNKSVAKYSNEIRLFSYIGWTNAGLFPEIWNQDYNIANQFQNKWLKLRNIQKHSRGCHIPSRDGKENQYWKREKESKCTEYQRYEAYSCLNFAAFPGPGCISQGRISCNPVLTETIGQKSTRMRARCGDETD